MDNNKNNMNESLGQSIRKNWAIIIFIIGLVVGWTQLNGEVSANTEKIQELKNEQATNSHSIQVIDNKLTEIQTTLTFIKEKLE